MRCWWLQAEALAGEVVLQCGLESELGAEAAACHVGGIGGQRGQGHLRAWEGAVEAGLRGTTGLQKIWQGQGR